MRVPRSRAEALRLAARHRGALAALAAAAAVVAGLQVLAPPAAATVPVLIAAKDLRWGSPLRAGDLVVTAVPRASVPDGALRDAEAVLGRLLSSPVRRGEALTDLRLVGPGLLSDPGLVAVGVRIADAGTAALVRAGSRVDVLAARADAGFEAPGFGGAAEVVASGMRVLAVPTERSAGSDGALLMLAATDAQAARLAGAGGRLSIALRPDVAGG